MRTGSCPPHMEDEEQLEAEHGLLGRPVRLVQGPQAPRHAGRRVEVSTPCGGEHSLAAESGWSKELWGL